MADEGGKKILVVDGDEGKPYASIVETDLERLHNARKAIADAFYIERPFIFKPDGQRVAYVARVGEKRFNVSEKWSVVVDGKEQSPYEGIGGLTFSSDSRHVAMWLAKDPSSLWWWTAKRAGNTMAW